jgi:hypothetical protein
MTPEGSVDRQRQKINEFMQMLPLTLALAGLPSAPAGSYFNEGQLEARATALRAAFKQARAVLLDIAK